VSSVFSLARTRIGSINKVPVDVLLTVGGLGVGGVWVPRVTVMLLI